MRYRALLAARSPPRDSRWRVTFARGRRHRGRPAQRGEGGLVAQSVRVGAGGGQQLGGGVGTDTVSGAQRGIDLCNKDIQLGSEVLLLTLEELDALGQCLGGGPHRDGGRVAVGGGPASGQCRDQGGGAVAAVAFAQLGGCGDQQSMDLVGRGGMGLDRAAQGAQQRPQGAGVRVFGHGQTLAGQCGSRSGIGVERVGFALATACGPIRAADLSPQGARRLQDGSGASDA